ncbi:MAG: hypothetical protein ACRD08_17430, partial [Acidimicrobiales bacterium]
MASTHGRRVDDGRVWVAASQAKLAQEHGCSAGTVAYYLRAAGAAVERRRGGLLVDTEALTSVEARGDRVSRHRQTLDRLTQAWPCRPAGDGRYELLVDGIRCPTESDVAEVLGVARSAAHERLVRLEAARLLERTPGRWLANLTARPPHLVGGHTGVS